MVNLKKIFSNNSVFSQFGTIELSKLCQYGTYINIKADENIFSIDDQLEYYYLIISGEVEVTNNLGESKRLKSGDSFGDETIVDFQIALYSARAITDCQILIIEKKPVQSLNRKYEKSALFTSNLSNNISVFYQDDVPKILEEDEGYIGNLLRWIAVVIVPVLATNALFSLEHPPNTEQALLIYLFLSSVLMWYFRLVPEFIPALYLMLGMVLLSLAPTHIILNGFYSNPFFLAIALSALSIIIKSSGLSYRIFLSLFYRLGSHKFWRHFVLFLSGGILTPIIPTGNGRANLLYPLFKEALMLHKIKKGSLEYQRLMVTTIGGFSLLSPIFLTSKSINFIALGMLSIQDQYIFQFYYWLVSTILVAIILITFYAFFSWIIFKNDDQTKINMALIKDQIDILGSFRVEEIFTTFAIFTFVVIILASNLHNIDIAWLAMLLVTFLFTLGFLKRDNFNHSIDWDFLMFLSALLGFANVINFLEIAEWMAHYTAWITEIINHNFIYFIAILSATIFLLRLLLPINITVIVLAGILVPVIPSEIVSPWLVVFIILLMSESYTYNFSASYVMQFLSLAKDDQNYPRIILLQILIYVVKLLAIIISIPYWQYLGILV